MSRIAKLRQRTRGSAGNAELERQVAQQKRQFGHLGARLRNLRELNTFAQPAHPAPKKRKGASLTESDRPSKRRRRKNAPPAAPGYVHLLSELREQAHLQRVDDTFERLLEYQDRHRHLVSSTRPLLAHDTRHHYTWRNAQVRPSIARCYHVPRPLPPASVWAALAALDLPTDSPAARPSHPAPASADLDQPQAVPADSSPPPLAESVGISPVPAWQGPRYQGPASEPTGFVAINTDVQRRWLQDKVRAIDLIPPEILAHLPVDVREFLESHPTVPLWEHQIDATLFMLYCESHMHFGSRGGMICDEMGLGKTRLMIEIVYRTRQLQMLRDPSRRHYRPTLLIVPNSISYHPARELARAYPANLLRVIRLCEGENQAAGAKDIEAHVDLIITTYPTVSRAFDARFREGSSSGYEVLFDLTYERIIVDEGHVFANPHTIMNQAVMELSTRAAHNWFFSGTPIQNRFSDIDAALRFICIDDAHIPRAPVVRVHAQNLLEIQRRLEEMEHGLRSSGDRAEFRDLWQVLAGRAVRSDGPPDNEEAEEEEEEEEEPTYLDLLSAVNGKSQRANEKKRKKKKKKKRHALVHITQRGVRHFLELYRCRSVMRVGQARGGVDALVERTIAEVYRSLEASGGRELAAYTSQLEELLGTCMLRRTRASVGYAFGRQVTPHERVTVALPGGKNAEIEADAEGFLGPRYLRTHALFSRESDPFSEQLCFYSQGTAESLLYGFYDAQRIDLTLHPHAHNIFEYDVTAQGPFNPAQYELAQAAWERPAITAKYLALRGDAVTELDRQVCRIYERHFTLEKRTRPRKRSKSETRTLVAQRSLMAICSQMGTSKRVFLPPFLDPPDASESPAALFTQRTEYQRLTHLSASALEYCQATARELKLGGIDGPDDDLWTGRRRLRLPAESTQFREIKRAMQGLQPGEKMIVPFNSVETLLQLYFYVREWFPLPADGEAGPHIQPLVLVGDMDTADRRVAMERFETDPNYNVLLASMQVTSLGHNLDMANIVLAPDANYNPQHLRQATFRTARPGQTRRILLRVLIPRGTVVEHALLIGHEKMSMEEATIGGERASSRSTARSRRGASRISNFINSWKARELDKLTRVGGG